MFGVEIAHNLFNMLTTFSYNIYVRKRPWNIENWTKVTYIMYGSLHKCATEGKSETNHSVLELENKWVLITPFFNAKTGYWVHNLLCYTYINMYLYINILLYVRFCE